MQFNNPQRNKMIVTLTTALKVMTHQVLLCTCLFYESYYFVIITVLLKYIIHLHNIGYINTWLLLHASLTCCTVSIFCSDIHDLISTSIISHHQVNEINYQCLKNTFVFVLSRSVTLNASTCGAR